MGRAGGNVGGTRGESNRPGINNIIYTEAQQDPTHKTNICPRPLQNKKFPPKLEPIYTQREASHHRLLTHRIIRLLPIRQTHKRLHHLHAFPPLPPRTHAQILRHTLHAPKRLRSPEFSAHHEERREQQWTPRTDVGRRVQ